MFEGGTEKLKEFGAYYKDVATNYGCHFIDAGMVIRSSPVDGIHFDAREHAKLRNVVADKVMEIMRYFFD
jgi:hypothetical protein